MGHVVKTPAGSFRANWRDGNERQRSKTFERKREANAFLSQIEAALSRGTYVDPNAGRVLVADFAERWLKGRVVGARSEERTLSVLRTHVIPRWGRTPMGKIDHLSVQTWVGDLSRELPAGTVAKALGLLSQLTRSAVRSRVIVSDPTEGIMRPSTYRRKAELVTVSREVFFSRFFRQSRPSTGRWTVWPAARAFGGAKLWASRGTP